MYVCMYVRTYVRTYVCMYVCQALNLKGCRAASSQNALPPGRWPEQAPCTASHHPAADNVSKRTGLLGCPVGKAVLLLTSWVCIGITFPFGILALRIVCCVHHHSGRKGCVRKMGALFGSLYGKAHTISVSMLGPPLYGSPLEAFDL